MSKRSRDEDGGDDPDMATTTTVAKFLRQEDDTTSIWASLFCGPVGLIAYHATKGYLGDFFGMSFVTPAALIEAKLPDLDRSIMGPQPGTINPLSRGGVAKRGEKKLRKALRTLGNLVLTCRAWLDAVDWRRLCATLRAQLKGARTNRPKLLSLAATAPNLTQRQCFTLACYAMAATPKEREPVVMAHVPGSYEPWKMLAEELMKVNGLDGKVLGTALVAYSSATYGRETMEFQTFAGMAARLHVNDLNRLKDAIDDKDEPLSLDWEGKPLSPRWFMSRYGIGGLSRIVKVWDYDKRKWKYYGPYMDAEVVEQARAHWRQSQHHYEHVGYWVTGLLNDQKKKEKREKKEKERMTDKGKYKNMVKLLGLE